MLDGMVAVEGGKGSPDGPIWNEAPDRYSDIVILVGAGYGAAFAGAASPSLGWAAAVFAVMTLVRLMARRRDQNVAEVEKQMAALRERESQKRRSAKNRDAA